MAVNSAANQDVTYTSRGWTGWETVKMDSNTTTYSIAEPGAPETERRRTGLQERLATLQELCMRGGAEPGALDLLPAAFALGPAAARQQQRALAALATPELMAACAPPEGSALGACAPPPRDMVRALRELAAVRRDRDRLAAQARSRMCSRLSSALKPFRTLTLQIMDMMDAWCELAAVWRERDQAAAQARGPAHVWQARRDFALEPKPCKPWISCMRGGSGPAL